MDQSLLKWLELTDLARQGLTVSGLQVLPKPIDVRLDADSLLFTWHSERARSRTELTGDDEKPVVQNELATNAIPADLWEHFLKLESDTEVLAFARQWGPLNVANLTSERVNEWKKYAKLARAMLLMAIDLQRIDTRVWDTFAPAGFRDRWLWFSTREHWLAVARYALDSDPAEVLGGISRTTAAQIGPTLLALAFNRCYNATSGNHFIARPAKGGIEIRPGATTLLGTLITQLAYVIAAVDQKIACFNFAECRNFFTPLHKTDRGQRRYCKACRRRKVPNRDRQRKHYAEHKKQCEQLRA
jgi:hypothetical protein